VKRDKVKPGTASELAAMYPAPKAIPVRLVRIQGEGRTREVFYDPAKVTVCGMPIEQLGRISELLIPLADAMGEQSSLLAFLSEHKEEALAVVAEAIDWPIDELRLMHASDFITVAMSVVNENINFFVRLLGPAAFALPGIQAEVPGNGAGPKPSVSFAAGETRTPNATPSSSSMPQ
jgi:hypothetical protein